MVFQKGHPQFNTGRTRWKKGEHISRATEFKKGQPAPKTAFKKGRKSPMKGISISKEIRDKIRKAFTKKKREEISVKQTGHRNSNWRGGTTPENKRIRKSIEFRLWREAVFARDNWTCQKCYEQGGKLHPHHIKSFAKYPKLRFAIDNGITYCESCHKKFHKQEV